MRDHPIDAGVTLLLRPSGPTAILWAVAEVIVNAVKRIIWRWPASHILEKIVKALQPTVTDGYSPAAIVLPASIFGIVTSALDCLPGMVLWCIRIAVLGSTFSTEAPARRGIPASKIPPMHDGARPAIAEAAPCDLFAYVLGTFNHNQPAVPIPCLINQFRHLTSNAKAALARFLVAEARGQDGFMPLYDKNPPDLSSTMITQNRGVVKLKGII